MLGGSLLHACLGELICLRQLSWSVVQRLSFWLNLPTEDQRDIILVSQRGVYLDNVYASMRLRDM